MAAISREEVAHLARLSRLAVTEEELDRFAGQLDVILQAVARVGEVAAADIPPTSHSVPLTNVLREDVVVPGLSRADALAGAPDGPRTGSAYRGSWTRRPDVTDLITVPPPPQLSWAACWPRARSPRSRSRRPTWTASRAVDERVHAFLHVDTEGALAAAAAVDAARGKRRRELRPAGRRADRGQGRHRHPGRADHLRLEDPRGLAPAVRRHDRDPDARGRPGHARQDQHGRVRDGIVH